MQLPPLQVTRAVIQRYSRLLHRYESDLGTRPFVLPNASFFPDQFLGDEASVSRLVSRMLEHAGLDDIPVTCRVIDPQGPTQTSASSCSSGACGVPQSVNNGMQRLVDQGDSWLVQVPAAELRHSVALTTNLARSLAFIFLVETQKENELLEPPVDVTADLIAVALGFGPLILQGSYIYAKSCGGPQIASVTKTGVAELAIAVALFAHLGDHKLAPALKELDVTQRALLQESHDLLRANQSLLRRIKHAPMEVSRETFNLAPSKGIIGRIFGGRKQKSTARTLNDIDANMDLDEVESLMIDMPPSSRAGRASTPPSSQRKKEELKGMVAEAFSESGL